MEEISEESRGETGSKASGMATKMEKFASFFGLKLSFLVFSATEQLSVTLQNSDLNAQQVMSAATAALDHLERLRSDSTFIQFYQGTLKEAEGLTEEPKLPRQRQIPKRLDAGSCNHSYATPEAYYRQLYFEVIDLVTNEMKQRFDQPTFTILQEIEKLLLDSCSGKLVQPSATFQKMYESDFPRIDRLSLQLSMLPDLIKTANEQHDMGLKKVTSISTLCDVFNTCVFAKTMLSDVDRLIRIYLTTPMSTATAERTFSTLRCLKNYLRTTTTQKRLNHTMLLHCHKARTDQLDLLKIAKEFVAKNSRRKEFFGSFDYLLFSFFNV